MYDRFFGFGLTENKALVKEIKITFINKLLGLAGVDGTNDSRIINKTTGLNLEGNNGLDLQVKVGSPTSDTNIRVELYKRNPTYEEKNDNGNSDTSGITRSVCFAGPICECDSKASGDP